MIDDIVEYEHAVLPLGRNGVAGWAGPVAFRISAVIAAQPCATDATGTWIWLKAGYQGSLLIREEYAVFLALWRRVGVGQ